MNKSIFPVQIQRTGDKVSLLRSDGRPVFRKVVSSMSPDDYVSLVRDLTSLANEANAHVLGAAAQPITWLDPSLNP